MNGKGVPSEETEEFLLTNNAIYLFKAFVALKDHQRAAVLHFAKSLARQTASAGEADW